MLSPHLSCAELGLSPVLLPMCPCPVLSLSDPDLPAWPNLSSVLLLQTCHRLGLSLVTINGLTADPYLQSDLPGWPQTCLIPMLDSVGWPWDSPTILGLTMASCRCAILEHYLQVVWGGPLRRCSGVFSNTSCSQWAASDIHGQRCTSSSC